MESEDSPQQSRIAVAQWTDLPPELVEIISSNFQNPNDITRFRSLCRSWRLYTSPPPSTYIISPFFPLPVSPQREISPHITILASAVLLLRSRLDPSKPLIVYAQETDAGKLVLRHALTHEKIAGTPGKSLDLLEWSVTEIANSYGYNRICKECNQIETTEKVALASKQNADARFRVSTSTSNSTSTSRSVTAAVALYNDYWRIYRCRFLLGLRRPIVHQLTDESNIEIEDTVNFNGRNIYGINSAGHVFLLNNTNMRLIRVKSRSNSDFLSKSCQKRFVVSDGDLYVVSRFRREFDNPPECEIYKIVMENQSSWEWERVEDLGDKVFFLIRDCSFSMSARDLPHPWKGNCVIVDTNVHREAYPICGCYPCDKEIEVFHLGDEQPRFSMLSSLMGYSDVFTPPSSWIMQRDVKAQESTSSSQSVSVDDETDPSNNDC